MGNGQDGRPGKPRFTALIASHGLITEILAGSQYAVSCFYVSVQATPDLVTQYCYQRAGPGITRIRFITGISPHDHNLWNITRDCGT